MHVDAVASCSEVETPRSSRSKRVPPPRSDIDIPGSSLHIPTGKIQFDVWLTAVLLKFNNKILFTAFEPVASLGGGATNTPLVEVVTNESFQSTSGAEGFVLPTLGLVTDSNFEGATGNEDASQPVRLDICDEQLRLEVLSLKQELQSKCV